MPQRPPPTLRSHGFFCRLKNQILHNGPFYVVRFCCAVDASTRRVELRKTTLRVVNLFRGGKYDCLRRIFAALAPRVTAHDTPDRFATTMQQSVSTNGLNRISAASRLKSTCRGNHGADDNLINPHAPNHTCSRYPDDFRDHRSRHEGSFL